MHPSLLRQVARSQAPVSFLVILSDQPDPASFLVQKRLGSASRSEKAAALYDYLTSFARQSQTPLWRWLDAQGAQYRPFYIVNAIEVTGDAELVAQLRRRAEVDRLAANPRVGLQLPDQSAEATTETRVTEATAAPYGILYTKAPQVWAQGIRGQGIVVASQDTGVDWTHPALQSKYRGWITTTQTVTHPYNWFDYWGTASRFGCDPDPQVPCDDNGHGTHTVGTMLGSDDSASQQDQIVGMAPDATWIGCRNMNSGKGTPGSYMGCFEFFLAPYPQDGDPFVDGKPELAPHIINNSWYCPPSEGCDFDSLAQIVKTVRAAGQLIVASAGNQGGSCATIQYPISAYPEVFSVGAHNSAGTIAGFSSRGPVTVDGSGRLKPEIVAPGESVRSTFPGGGYGTLSGTSMAAPHVAGAAALIWSAAPYLIGQLDETEEILMKSAEPVPHADTAEWYYNTNGMLVCEPATEARTPNYTYGYGRLDVAAAVEMALNPAQMTVTISDIVSDTVVANVVLTDTLTGYTYTGTVEPSGIVQFPRVYPGTYEIEVNHHDHVVRQTLTLEPYVNFRKSEGGISIEVTWSIKVFLPLMRSH